MMDNCRRVVLFVLDNAHVRAHYNRLLTDSPHCAIYAMDGAEGFDRFLEARPDICLISDSISRISVTILCQLIREHEKGKDIGLFVLSDQQGDDPRFAKLQALDVDAVRPMMMGKEDFAALLKANYPSKDRNHQTPADTPASAAKTDIHQALTTKVPAAEAVFASQDLVVIDEEDAQHSGMNSDSIVMQLKPQEFSPELPGAIVDLTPIMQKEPAQAAVPLPKAEQDQAEVTSPNPVPQLVEIPTSPKKAQDPFKEQQERTNPSYLAEEQGTPALSRHPAFAPEPSGIHEAIDDDADIEQTDRSIAPKKIPESIEGLNSDDEELPDISDLQTLKKIPVAQTDEVHEQATPVVEQAKPDWNPQNAQSAAAGEVFDTRSTSQEKAGQSKPLADTKEHLANPQVPAADDDRMRQPAQAKISRDEPDEADENELLPLSDEERDSMTVRQAISGSQLGGRLTRRVLALFRLLDSVDYYQLLGVDLNADHEALQQAFHNLALEYHPDRFFPLAEGFIKERIRALFTRICEAYTVLSERSSRERYDAMLANHTAGPPPRYILGQAQHHAEAQHQSAYTPVGRKYLRLAVAAMARGDKNAAQLNLTFALSHEPDNEALRQRLEAIAQDA